MREVNGIKRVRNVGRTTGFENSQVDTHSPCGSFDCRELQ